MKPIFAIFSTFLGFTASFAQGIQSFSFPTAVFPSTLPASNAVDVLTVTGDTVWVGTSSGLSRTIDGSSWSNFAGTSGFDEKGISAIAANAGILWTSSAFVERRDDAFIQTGAGLRWTTDRGMSWTFVPQPVDAGIVDTLVYGSNLIKALAITVPQQNITYDIALTTNAVWIASWAGNVRRSTDRGLTWERIILPPDNRDSITPTDTLDFDLAPTGGAFGLRPNLNHVAFSVHASSDSVIWVGTAAGINKSTDGGVSWSRFSHQNQVQAISGNFVVALNEQLAGSDRVLWAATVNAVDPAEQQGVSYSSDGGASWRVTLDGERAHNIAFKDSIVYVATNRGLFRSSDRGGSWLLSGFIFDGTTGQQFVNPTLYAVCVKDDTVWVGGPEGTAYTLDDAEGSFGASWRIFRTYEPLGTRQETYSYPLPFSPDNEVTRLHYTTGGTSRAMTIRIYDFAMQPVRTVIQNAMRSGNHEHDEVWDGLDDRGNRASNGVYFYSVEADGFAPLWGKIMVLR